MKTKHPYFNLEPNGNVELQPRDFEFFEHLLEHRLLDSEMLGLLTGHPGGSTRSVQARLRILTAHKFLIRPEHQLALRVMGEQRHLVYGLGRGAQALAERFGLSLDGRRWTQKNRDILFIQHTLGVNRFYTCLHLAIPQNAPHDGVMDYSQPYCLPWRQGKDIKAQVWLPSPSGRKERWTLTPDAFCGIQTPEPPPNKTWFFLEYQRSTPDQARFVHAKGHAYFQLWKEGMHEERFKIKHYRVLVISQTQKKVETLRRYIREWLAHEPNPPWAMWLFTVEGRYTLDRPVSILEPIWTTANEERLISLLD